MVDQQEKIKSNSLFTAAIKTHADNIVLQAEDSFNKLRKDPVLQT